MRIVIDLQGAQTESRFRGIGRYTLSLAKAIVRNRGDHEVIIALSSLFPDTIESIRGDFKNLLPQENIRVWHAPGPVRYLDPENTWRREAAELIREYFIASLQPDIVYIASLFEGYGDDAVSSIGKFDQTTLVVVSIFDLIPILNSDHYFKPNPTYESYFLMKIDYLQRSPLLLAISKYTQQEVIENLDLHATSIVNVSTAVEANFLPITLSKSQEQIIRDKFMIPCSFLLYTGGSDERKNLLRLIHAYSKLSTKLRNTHQLVFVGKFSKDSIYQLQQEAKSIGLQTDELIFTGYVTDTDLVKLYNLCKLFILPSWHEGFGIPALEAMSCGAAVIASNAGSLPEVIGNADALFDPFSEESIAEKITCVLTNEGFWQGLIKHGLNQAKKFSWDKSGRVAISAFEKLIEKRNINNRLPATHILSNHLAEIIPPDISERDLISLASAISLNHPQVGLKQLFVDVSELSQRDSATGVQRVTRSILIELLNSPPFGYKVEPVYATPESNGYNYAKKYTAQILGQPDISVTDESLVTTEGDIFLGLDLQHHVVISQADYFEQLKKKNISVFFVVYDLLPITFSKYFASNHSDLHTQWLEVISRFDGLACISKTVSLEVKEWLDISFPERENQLDISFFNMGADIENSLPSKGLPEDCKNVIKRLQSSNSFLMVGTLEPRKGQNKVMLAFEELWFNDVDVNLVLVGKKGWMVENLIDRIRNHPQLGKRLFWLNGISDEYLEKIYDSSDCLIAASVDEGFGLPLIEAAQHGLAIIARDIPVFREVASQYAYYFRDDSPGELAKTIEQWIFLYQKKKHPSSNKIPWVTWKQSTDRLLEKILPCEVEIVTKQLLIDVSELVQRDARSGIQRVVRSILKELLTHPPKGFCIEPVYATNEHGYRYARKFISSFINSSLDLLSDELVEYRTGDIFLGLDFQPQVVPIREDFFQQLRRDGVRVYFVVYDLLVIRRPEWFPQGSADGFVDWLSIITKADGAICISKYTAEDLSSWIIENNISSDRGYSISVSHIGADVENSSPSYGIPKDADTVFNALSERPSFVSVGTIEPRKSYDQIISTFELLWESGVDINLVIIGKEGWMVKSLIEKIKLNKELNNKLFWLEGVADEYLVKVYAKSTCLIAASEGEGFGLPLIEAAQHKLPIIARDIPVFKEVAGQHAFYFTGKSPENLADAINGWMVLYNSDKHPKSDNMPWLTWKESTNQLTNVLLNSDKVGL